MKNSITIFTDGSSRGNPGPGGWGAVIVVPTDNDGKVKSDPLFKLMEGRPGEGHDPENTKVKTSQSGAVIPAKLGIQIIELGGAEKNTTNNQMELTAAIKALTFCPTPRFGHSIVEIFTDSSYLINGITKWVSGWRINGWKTKTKKEVLNRKLWEELANLAENKNIQWKYLGGHSGIAGNERCDEIATEFADSIGDAVRPEQSLSTAFKASRGATPKLYSGPISKYPIDILNFDLDELKTKEKAAARSHQKAAAYSYLSMVDGKIQTHKTWADCENRVKGKSGARFKKAISAKEEKEIIDFLRHSREDGNSDQN